jgi:hypothetical protein
MDAFSGPSWLSGKPERLVGATQLIGATDWTQRAVYSPNEFKRGLHDLGFPEAEVQGALALQAEVAERDRQVGAKLAELEERDRWTSHLTTPADVLKLLRERESLYSRLKDWLGGRELRIQDVAESPVRVPLFLLSAPAPEGCVTMFQQSVMRGQALTWTLSVGGSGLGGGSTLQVSSSWQFSAQSGERKAVFVPLTVTVARVDIVANGRTLSSGVQVVASELKETQPPGLVLLEPDAHPPIGQLLKEFSLSGDTTGAVATYDYNYEHRDEGSLQVGLEAFGVKTSVAFQATMTSAAALKLELRGGHDYIMHSLAEGGGIAWPSPG